MRLFFLRHADAGSASSDSARPLTNLGIRQVEQLAHKFSAKYFSGIAAVEHSPLLRARQTAEYFKKYLELEMPLKICDYITPDYDGTESIKRISVSEADRLLVGHNMLYYKLAGNLLGGGEKFVEVAFGNACLLGIERFACPSPRRPFGGWQLLRFVGPDDET